MSKKMLLLLLFLLIIPIASAATIQGNVYNNLLKSSIATVEINTEPTQRLVVNNNYKFTISPGTYTIKAYYLNLKTEETITITKEGIYNLDLVMFPSFEDEEELLDFNIDIEYEKKSTWFYWLIVIGLILIALSKFLPKKKKKILREDDELTKKVINFIKQKGGRVTQKEIRKQFPLSEAKISLVITDLEHKGRIQKIKKGRSNVIILK